MPLSGESGQAATSNYGRVIQQVPSGTENGASISGWNLLPLNTVTHNEGNILSLAANVITLQPGVYRAFCLHGGFVIFSNRLRLRNTDTGTYFLGLNTFTPNGNDPKSFVAETFTISTVTNFVLEMYTLTNQAVFGLGRAQSIVVVPAVDEQYTVAEFIQIGTA